MALFAGVEIAGRPDLRNVARLDLLPIPFIRRAHRIGMAVDREAFRALSAKFAAEIVEVDKDIASYIPIDRVREFSDRSEAIENEHGEASFNPGSAEQIGKLLFDMLGIGEGKELKRTRSGDRISTGKRQLEVLRMTHPVVPRVLRRRELAKLKNTYADKLPLLARFHPRGGCCPICELSHRSPAWRVHGEMGTTRADTGRINHKNPNLGNIPTRTEDGQSIQACFIAPEGYRMIDRDLSQIELRCQAHLANVSLMIETYANDGDIHDQTARKVFRLADDVKPDKIKHRMAAKRCAFSIQNGTTAGGLYMQLVMDYGLTGLTVPDWLNEEWTGWFITQYLDTYHEIRTYFEQQWYRARRYKMVWDLFGRVKLIPEVRSVHSWIRGAGLRYAQNMPVTATAAGQLKLGMGKTTLVLDRLREAGAWVEPLLTIHDAIKVEAEEEAAEEVDSALEWAMDTVMEDEETGEHCFRVVIKSDGDIKKRWEK